MLGPAEAPLAVIKGRYRFRLLVKSARNVDLSHYLRDTGSRTAPKPTGNLKLEVDIDPQSFFELDRHGVPTKTRLLRRERMPSPVTGC